MELWYMLGATAAMAAITYLTRVLSLVLFKKKFKNRYISSFLHYVPYGVLAALVIPSVFYSVSGPISAAVGFAVALVTSYFGMKLLPVSALSVLAVYITELLVR